MTNRLLGLTTALGLGLAFVSVGMVLPSQAKTHQSVAGKCMSMIESGKFGQTGDYIASDMPTCMAQLRHQRVMEKHHREQ